MGFDARSEVRKYLFECLPVSPGRNGFDQTGPIHLVLPSSHHRKRRTTARLLTLASIRGKCKMSKSGGHPVPAFLGLKRFACPVGSQAGTSSTKDISAARHSRVWLNVIFSYAEVRRG